MLAAICILLMIFLWTMLKKKEQPQDYKPIITAYDKAIEAKDQVITIINDHNYDLDKRILDHQLIDSILLQSLLNNQPRYKANDKKLQDINRTVPDYTKEQLRRELSDY